MSNTVPGLDYFAAQVIDTDRAQLDQDRYRVRLQRQLGDSRGGF